jgi:hypothetical protein
MGLAGVKEGMMDAAEFAAALIAVLETELSRKGDMTLTTGGLMSRIRKALDPEASKGFERPPVPPQPAGPPPEFPKLKVRYHPQTGQPLEHVVCETIFEEVPYMSAGWYRRPLSELEQFRRATE